MPRDAFTQSVQKLCTFWSAASLAKLCKAAPAPEPSEPSEPEQEPLEPSEDVEAKEVNSIKSDKPITSAKVENVEDVEDPFDGAQLSKSSGLWSAETSNGCVPGVPGTWSGSYIAKKYNVVVLKVDIDKSSTTFKFWDELADRVVWMQQILTV